MMFHAAKSGHENFSESAETIAPLTPEERAQKAAELRDRIRAARALKAEQERKEEEARKAAQSGVQPTPAPTPAPVSAAPAPTTDYKNATIQVRLLNGQAVRQTFGASEPLSAVRLWLELNHSDGIPFTLLQPFPRKVMTDEDYDKPLKELGLVPSANFVMTR
ncbi:UBX domain protein [Ancylostoma ceylanicum]|uniref:UBX domain protein n=1 Tax=Ancylostoma ceylanicum TaxID=53326 RepID=A0A0D6M5V6_9BILA|nr:UBX domain protein [Ancylostoma ceylanicum]